MRFITYLINGISLGSIYAIIALGYTMVYGIAKMLNFAHGDVIMIGCYVVFMTMSGMNMNPLLSVILAVVVCTVLGVIIEKVAYKPLRKASPLAVLITAIGVSKVIVPTDVPMASETKHATPNKTATENLVGMIDNIKYATLSALLRPTTPTNTPAVRKISSIVIIFLSASPCAIMPSFSSKLTF